MIHEMPAVGATAGVALAGLVLSNFLCDRGVPNSVTRCVAAALGGAAFLLAVLWLEAATAIALSASMTLFILALHLGFGRSLRGTKGSLPSQAWAEVTYALAGTVSLAVGWGLLGDRWLALVPVAFMAWGDNAAGLTRATFRHDNASDLWPSLAMLVVCLAAAALFWSYWIAAMGAAVAVTAERFRPRVTDVWDDNLHVVAMSLSVMAVLVRVT